MSKKSDFLRIYSGPHHLTDDVETALNELNENLVLGHSEHTSHSVLLVDNFDDTCCLNATAVYLVSAIAQNIDANLEIREVLFGENTLTRELSEDVIAVIGESTAEDQFRTMVRDPWMWEAISHMFVHLSRKNTGFHVSGRVLAKTQVKYDVHDHGLDVIAIYEASTLGISAGECKAYLDNPSRGITHASNRLREVDSNERDIELRAAVNQLRSALPDSAQRQIAGSFWRNQKSYLPFVCCDNEYVCDWSRNRKVLRELALPASQKILLPLALPKARKVFDRICKVMRFYASLEESA